MKRLSKAQIKKRRRYRLTALLLYLIFCGFLWCFLLAAARSHNRLSREPAAMAQLIVQPETVALHLPDASFQWKLVPPGEGWILWSCIWPDFAGQAAIWTWHDLYCLTAH